MKPFLAKSHKAQPANLRCFWVSVALKQSLENHFLQSGGVKGQLRCSSEASMSMSDTSGWPPERLEDMALSNCTCKKHQQKLV